MDRMRESLAAADQRLAPAAGPDAPGWRPIALDFGVTAVIVALLVGLALAINTWADGKIQQQFGLKYLSATLISFLPLLPCSLLERMLPAAGPHKSLRRWLIHVQINLFNFIAYSFAGILGATTAALFGKVFGLGLIDLRFAGGLGILGLAGAFMVSVIVHDFFFYWYHRCLHRSQFLWQLHKLHHMDQELDVLTAARENWIDAFLTTLFVTLPLVLFFKFDSTDPLVIGAIPGFVLAFLHMNQGTFIHLNCRVRLGVLTPFWCGPQLHRIHHSRLPQHRDKNFAATFPVWDILFGTYYAPARDEFPPTGVDGEQEIRHFVESQIFTLREWYKMFRRRRGGAISS